MRQCRPQLLRNGLPCPPISSLKWLRKAVVLPSLLSPPPRQSVLRKVVPTIKDIGTICSFWCRSRSTDGLGISGVTSGESTYCPAILSIHTFIPLIATLDNSHVNYTNKSEDSICMIKIINKLTKLLNFSSKRDFKCAKDFCFFMSHKFFKLR